MSCPASGCARESRTHREARIINSVELFGGRPLEDIVLPERQFVPVWKGSGNLQTVLRMESSQIPNTVFKDGQVPEGEETPEVDLHYGIFHPVDEEAFLAAQKEITWEAHRLRQAFREHRREEKEARDSRLRELRRKVQQITQQRA